jgi:hypothetical protein
MRKALSAGMFSAVLGLIVATAWLVMTPVPVLASTCSAQCRNGIVTCQTQSSYEYCYAEDGVGCAVFIGAVMQESKDCDGLTM